MGKLIRNSILVAVGVALCGFQISAQSAPPAQSQAVKLPTDAEIMAMAAKSGAKLGPDGIVQSSKVLEIQMSDEERRVALLTPTVATRGAQQVVAYAFSRPDDVFGAGHIGWGYYAPNMKYWVGGATENPVPKDLGALKKIWIAAGSYTGYWSAAWNTEAEMAAEFKRRGYSHLKRVAVGSPNPDLAWARANYTRDNGYRGAGWNCLDHTYYILEGFGVRDLPWTQTHWFPNDWFNAMPGTVYRLP